MNTRVEKFEFLQDDLVDVKELGHATLKLADTHDAPPQPMIYEVLYSYLSDSYPDLRSAIDEALESDQQLTVKSIVKLHEHYFQDRYLADGIANISSQVEDSLESAEDILSNGVEDAKDFSEGVEKIKDGLEAGDEQGRYGALAAELSELSGSYVQTLGSLREQFSEQARTISDLRRELRAIRNEALLDHLTQVSNRRHFDLSLRREIDSALSRGSSLALILCDIDHFKKFNDQHGHPAGDRLLQKFAEVLKNNTKRRDTVSRIGGEEFAIILPSTSLSGAVSLAEYLREYISIIRIPGQGAERYLRKITASFGVAVLRPGDTSEELCARADQYLYQAKNRGRNRVEHGPETEHEPS